MSRKTLQHSRQANGRLDFEADALDLVEVEGRRLVLQAMRDPDLRAIESTYTDQAGNRTRRVLSPIRWTGRHTFLALCLCREQPQSFLFPKCEDIVLLPAAELLMPVPIIELEGLK